MRVLAGTSGFSYDAWVGPFYPEDLASNERLRYYAARLPAVEIMSTFYRMPRAQRIEQWAGEVPAHFRFVLKASQRITHMKRLKDAGDDVAYFMRTAGALGERLGPVLFQTPPNLRKDLPRLEAFLALLPDGRRAAFEFRHASWLDDQVYAALRARGAALCVAEAEEMAAPLVATASWGYLRLRLNDCDDATLRGWRARIRAQPWDEAYVFFGHEEPGAGPKLAARFMELTAA